MDIIRIHPLANRFPLMKDKDVEALAVDIKANGLREPITLYQGAILEGRHRYQACAMAGVEPRFEDFTGDDAAALAFVISKNLHRRHLTAKQKRKAIADLITAQPEKSNRAIADQAKVDKNTVTAVRQEMEERGEIHHVEERIDTKGRKQPAKKKKAKKANKPPTEKPPPKFDIDPSAIDDKQRVRFEIAVSVDSVREIDMYTGRPGSGRETVMEEAIEKFCSDLRAKRLEQEAQAAEVAA